MRANSTFESLMNELDDLFVDFLLCHVGCAALKLRIVSEPDL